MVVAGSKIDDNTNPVCVQCVCSYRQRVIRRNQISYEKRRNIKTVFPHTKRKMISIYLLNIAQPTFINYFHVDDRIIWSAMRVFYHFNRGQ